MTGTVSEALPTTTSNEETWGDRVWALVRISLGFVFFWAFLDKLLALGFATGRNPETGEIDRFGDAAWINGANPTEGFLTFGLNTKEPFLSFYEAIAGMVWVDWVYMLSMFAVGLGLMLGISTRLAAWGGAIWMLFFYTASAIWPANNPFVDDHIVYALVLAGIALTTVGRTWSLDSWWSETGIVKRWGWLR